MANNIKKEHLIWGGVGVVIGIVGTAIYFNNKSGSAAFTGHYANVNGSVMNSGTNNPVAKNCSELLNTYRALYHQFETLPPPINTTNPAAVSLANQINAIARELNANGCGNYPEIGLSSDTGTGAGH